MRIRREKHTRYSHPMRFLSDERGATSIEYAILGSLIAAVIVFAVATLGSRIQVMFEAATRSW